MDILVKYENNKGDGIKPVQSNLYNIKTNETNKISKHYLTRNVYKYVKVLSTSYERKLSHILYCHIVTLKST